MITNKKIKQDISYCEVKHTLKHVGAKEVTLPEDEKFVDASMLFSVMSDNTRLKIIWLLCQGEYCVYDISAIIGMSAPAISHHIRSLRQLELINFKREGKHVLYSIAQTQSSDYIQKIVQDALN